MNHRVAVALGVFVVAACGGTVAPATTVPDVAQADAAMSRAAAGFCDFPAADAPAAHEEHPSDPARNAYERGLEETELEDYGAAQAAYAEALSLDPTYSTAAYNLGVSLVRLGRDEEAVAAFERAVTIDPTSVDALYNVGLLRYQRREFDAALGAFRRARVLAPREFDLTKKIVQSLHALGRFDEAAVERREARRVRACSDRADVREMTAFVIDQLEVDGETVYVYEIFEPDPQWTVYYSFRVIVGDRAVRAIQLESDPVTREQGVAALFGVDFPDERHFTTPRAYRDLPEYGAIRETALEIVRASRTGIPPG